MNSFFCGCGIVFCGIFCCHGIDAVFCGRGFVFCGLMAAALFLVAAASFLMAAASFLVAVALFLMAVASFFCGHGFVFVAAALVLFSWWWHCF